MRNKMLVALALFYSFFISMSYANTTDTTDTMDGVNDQTEIASPVHDQANNDMSSDAESTHQATRKKQKGVDQNTDQMANPDPSATSSMMNPPQDDASVSDHHSRSANDNMDGVTQDKAAGTAEDNDY